MRVSTGLLVKLCYCLFSLMCDGRQNTIHVRIIVHSMQEKERLATDNDELRAENIKLRDELDRYRDYFTKHSIICPLMSRNQQPCQWRLVYRPHISVQVLFVALSCIDRSCILTSWRYIDSRNLCAVDTYVDVARLASVAWRTFKTKWRRYEHGLPACLRSAPSLLSFKRQLKLFLFSRRYTWHCLSKPNIVDLAVFFNLGHFKKCFTLHYNEQKTWIRVRISISNNRS